MPLRHRIGRWLMLAGGGLILAMVVLNLLGAGLPGDLYFLGLAGLVFGFAARSEHGGPNEGGDSTTGGDGGDGDSGGGGGDGE